MFDCIATLESNIFECAFDRFSSFQILLLIEPCSSPFPPSFQINLGEKLTCFEDFGSFWKTLNVFVAVLITLGTLEVLYLCARF